MMLIFCSLPAIAQGADSNSRPIERAITAADFEAIREPRIFYGLASYYNNIDYYLTDAQHVEKLPLDQELSLPANHWFVAIGRFNALAVRGEGVVVTPSQSQPVMDLSTGVKSDSVLVKALPRQELEQLSPELGQLRYVHLWSVFSVLAKTAEAALVFIQKNMVDSWGLAILVFAVLMKILLLPVAILTVKAQRKVSHIQAQLAPKLAEIKANYDGEEAHNRLMEAHKSLNVTPFYALTPMMATLVQIPILIAVFNALGEMPQFVGEPFLWISDLAYPDSVGTLPLLIPMLGDSISLLPVLMTAVTVLATILFQDRLATEQEVKRQKRNLYLMGIAFFILFYPFPAAMVLYWTSVNILQIFQQRVIKI
ncbi:hypothetical protein BST96_06915 [Oceanicoccus sagamiensis]|uniref:Membrane insertase YidC/Oxa/ALB C-terminal domain-containing protein n=2 Tax=Oceanicoccus sagamiensis TaxID=716816 RepID=A0A1X9NLR3_9GAMM|nr:hypothetical protein BST96_06915 [Oceanicoccus sagamiensis]